VAAEELNIKGLTGVDISLKVAGPGTRAYAFLIDWHIRLLLALAWVAVGTLLLASRVGRTFQLAFLLPALLLYLFYHPFLEILMRGRTPGKRMAGARIVTLDGSTPGVGALLMRNVFRLIDQLPAMYVLGLACCMFTSQRVRFGDLAAGTVLVIDDRKTAPSLEVMGALAGSSHLDPEAASLVRRLLDRWGELEPQRAEALARDVLLRLDPQLDRAHAQRLDRRALHARLEGILASR
jgi:uncharacterized RDD family membrane protein YckC